MMPLLFLLLDGFEYLVGMKMAALDFVHATLHWIIHLTI